MRGDPTTELERTLIAELAECKMELERVQVKCFKCDDGSTPLYCLNCAEALLSAYNQSKGEK